MTGTELRRLREGLGMSRAKLGMKLKVTGQTIYRWEVGVHPIDDNREIAIRATIERIKRKKAK